jgi:hypothetical protein
MNLHTAADPNTSARSTSSWSLGIDSHASLGPWQEDHYPTVVTHGVVASNSAGRRFAYCGPVSVDRRVDAEALARRITLYHESHPAWTPVENKHWQEVEPVYGSLEYERQDCEARWANREREDAPWDEFFARRYSW